MIEHQARSSGGLHFSQTLFGA